MDNNSNDMYNRILKDAAVSVIFFNFVKNNVVLCNFKLPYKSFLLCGL